MSVVNKIKNLSINNRNPDKVLKRHCEFGSNITHQPQSSNEETNIKLSTIVNLHNSLKKPLNLHLLQSLGRALTPVA